MSNPKPPNSHNLPAESTQLTAEMRTGNTSRSRLSKVAVIPVYSPCIRFADSGPVRSVEIPPVVEVARIVPIDGVISVATESQRFPAGSIQLTAEYLTQTWLAVSGDSAATIRGILAHRQQQATTAAASDSQFQEQLVTTLARLTAGGAF